MTFDKLMALEDNAPRTTELLVSIQQAVLLLDCAGNKKGLQALFDKFPLESAKFYLLRESKPFNTARTREIVEADLARLDSLKDALAGIEVRPPVINHQQLLFGTTNPAKIAQIRACLQGLPVKILAPADLGIAVDVAEDGQTTEENAKIKALAYYDQSKMPTFSLDAALNISKLPRGQQPGVHVKPITAEEQEITDAALLTHYRRELESIGGISSATWSVGLAFVAAPDWIRTREFKFDVTMTAAASAQVIPRAALSSLMQHQETGKYYSEMTSNERHDVQSIAAAVQSWLELMEK